MDQKKLYYHGRKTGSRPYSGEYIYITDSLGYASGYSDGQTLYTYTIPFSKQKIFSIRNPRALQRLSKYVDPQSIKAILSTSGNGEEMDWAALTYIYNDNFSGPEEIFESLGYLGIALKERQGIESLYIFNEKNLDFRGTVDITTPQMIKTIGDFYRDFEAGKNFLEEHYGRNEILDELHAILSEGVADKYAERRFNIPDSNAEADRRATQAIPKDNTMGELIAVFPVWNYGKYENLRVFLNPRSLESFGEDVKALSTEDGDLIVAESNLPVYHADIMGAVDEQKIYGKQVFNAYDERHYITMHRINKTNEFGWSVSYRKFGEQQRNLKKVAEMTNAVRKKNPQYVFTPKYWEYIKTGEEPQKRKTAGLQRHPEADNVQANGYPIYRYDHNGRSTEGDDDYLSEEHPITTEGVADVYGERRFNLPNDSSRQNLRALQGLLGKPQAVIALRKPDGNTSVPIYKNPRTLEGFDADVRAIATIQGDLYVMQLNEEIMHGKMGVALGFFRVYDSHDFALLHRVGSTNDFGFGDSGRGYAEYNKLNWANSIQILRRTKAVNPQYDFYPLYFQTVEELDAQPVDAGGNDEYDNAPGEYEDEDVSEGVADKYAERRFNISDPNVAMDQKAIQGLPKDSSMGELVGAIGNQGNLYVNPRSLENFEADVRAISNGDNQLFVAQTNGSFLHFALGNTIKRSGGYSLQGGTYDESQNITWVRIKNTRAFGLGESMMNYYDKNVENQQDVIRRTAELQKHHKEFIFIPELYWSVSTKNLRETVISEGVADRAAERLFNIPDDNVTMDRRATVALPVETNDPKGKLVGEDAVGSKDVLRVFLNPRSLREFDNDVKAISNTEGDLFVAQNDVSIYHSDIVNAVFESDAYEGQLHNAYDELTNVTWHRIEDTNEFGWSVSYVDFGSRPENFPKVLQMIDAVKRKNPGFTFTRKYWQEIVGQRYDARHNINNDSLLNYESVIREEILNSNSVAVDSSPAQEFLLKELAENINEIDEKGIIRLYHRISGKHMRLTELLKSVLTRGLLPYDNGEIGEVIWFSDNFDDYGRNAVFVVSLDFDLATNGVANNEWEIVYTGHNAYAHRPIPIDALNIEKIPVAVINGDHIVDNVDMQKLIKDNYITAEQVNTGEIKMTVFQDIFAKYVRGGGEFLKELLPQRVKMINIL